MKNTPGITVSEVRKFRVTYTAFVYAKDEDEAGQNMLDCEGDFDTEVVEVDDNNEEVV